MDDPLAQFIASPRTDNQSASVVQIESTKIMPILVLLTLLCGLSIGVTFFAFSAARNADREARMLEYYVMELDGKLMAQNVIDSSRSWSAQKKQRENTK
jgi:hypothetical protein